MQQGLSHATVPAQHDFVQAVDAAQHDFVQVASVSLQQGLSHATVPAQHDFVQAVDAAQHDFVQVASVSLQQGLSHATVPAQHDFVQAVDAAQHDLVQAVLAAQQGLVQVATELLGGCDSQTPFSQAFDSQQSPLVVHEQTLDFESHLHSPPVQGQSAAWHLSPQQAHEAVEVES